MLRTTSTRGNSARLGASGSAPAGFGSTSRSTRYCLSSRSLTLKRGWCFLIRWFSRSSASFEDVTTIVSTSATARPRNAAAFAEVLPHPRAQVLGLPDVDDLVARILEQINAGLGRDSIEDVGGQHD